MAKKKAPNEVPADCMPMCLSCSFRRVEKETGGAFCHRYPPIMVTDDEGFGFSHVPVDDTDFCGEYHRSTN